MRDDALSVIVCGSSAATALAPYLVAFANEIDLPLRVLLTHAAERFVRPEVVGWYAPEVYTSDMPVNPVELARRSLGVIVLPATANLLASASLGLAATPAQTAVLAADHPAAFFPVMNQVMWDKPTTRHHVAALRERGHVVVEPEPGQTYELWSRTVTTGLTPPDPLTATQLVIEWLEKRLNQP